MPFQKGKKKTGGRTKGTANKSTKELQERLKYIIDENLEVLMEDFRSLDSIDRVKTLSQYLKYVMPQMKESDIKMDVETNVPDYLLDSDKLLDLIKSQDNGESK